MDIEQIAETINTDFMAAVKAAKKAQIAAIDGVSSAVADADAQRAAGLADVRKMQEDAAKIVSESLRRAEAVEATYRDAMRMAMAGLNDMRGPVAVPARRMKAIQGGKGTE